MVAGGDEKQPIVLALLHQPHRPPSGEKPRDTHIFLLDVVHCAPAMTVTCHDGDA